jgi:hypothetical protein
MQSRNVFVAYKELLALCCVGPTVAVVQGCTAVLTSLLPSFLCFTMFLNFFQVPPLPLL